MTPDRPSPDPSAHGTTDLVLAQGTLRGAGFRDRVGAAAAAGFAGIGLATRAYARLREQGWSDAALGAVLDDAGVRLVEVEGLLGFSSGGEVRAGVLAGRRYADPAAERLAFDMADAFGVRHLTVTSAFDGVLEPDAAAAFAGLCDRAAEHGLLVALEPMACSTVPDLAAAVRLVADAGRPNGGLCVDSWHLYRGGGDERQLRDVPAELVLVVQLDDGPVRPVDPDYLVDTLHHRQLPGGGELPLPAFLAALAWAGVRAPVSVEVLSDELDLLPPAEAALLAADATRRVLRAAGATAGAARRTAPDRALSVEGLLNVRDLGGLTTRDGRRVRRGRVVRSDNLRGLTDAGAVALVRDLRPRLVVDLRTQAECEREGRGLSDVEDVGYINVPLAPKAALTEEQVAAGLATNLYDDYLLQVRDDGAQLVAGLGLLAGDGHLPAVVHCTAGKDRTGVLVALLLDLLAAEREQVVADYAETTANMPGVLERIRSSPFFRANGLAAAPDWIFGSDPDTMRRFLAWLDAEHGGTEQWALHHGLPPDAVARLRETLLEQGQPGGSGTTVPGSSAPR